MNKDTAGNEIQQINQHCDCNSTIGCEKCNPMLKQNKYLSKCCNAEVVTANSGLVGETNYYICTKCHNDCDVIPNQTNDREEFVDFMESFNDYEYGLSGEDIKEVWSYFEALSQKKLEEERERIRKDLIKVAGAGELEDLRREVTCYFKSKQQERLRKICEKNKDDMTGLYDYDGIVSGVLSILEEEQK